MSHRHWWHGRGRGRGGRKRNDWGADGTLPLSEMDVGETGVVAAVEGGSWVLGRLASLGFTPGATVIVLQNPRHGPLIASVRDARVALGRHQASKVKVRRSDE